MNYMRAFIEANRQTGTTTALIKNIQETNGYLICGSLEIKMNLIRKYPEKADLIRQHVFSISELASDKTIGIKPGPVFFDTDAVRHMIPPPYSGGNNTGDNGDSKEKQINVKLSQSDYNEIESINKNFFEGEASISMVGRILIRKGIQFYNKLKDSI